MMISNYLAFINFLLEITNSTQNLSFWGCQYSHFAIKIILLYLT